MAITDKDGSISGARRLGSLTTQKSVKGSLEAPTDLTDNYSFSLTGRSSVSFSLTGLQSNAALSLLNSRGGVITSSNRRGKRNEQITTELESGQYFVLVSLFGQKTSYVLSGQATAIPVVIDPPPLPPLPPPGQQPDKSVLPAAAASPSTDPGPIPSLAFNTGILTTAKVYAETVGGSDAADFYRFSINQPTLTNIYLANVTTGSNAIASLIYDINGNGFVDSGDEIANSSAGTITRALSPGTYFVGVTANTSNTSYNLVLDPSIINGITPPADPFFGLGRATNLGTVSGLVNVKQVVGITDSADIYKFTLSDPVSNFTARLNTTQSTGDVTISLIYDDDGNGIANPGELVNGLVVGGNFIGGTFTTGSAGGATLVINKTLGAGTYYIAVTQKDFVDNTTYDFSLLVNNAVSGLNPASDPGNSIPQVRDNPSDPGNLGDLTTITGTLNLRQFVGSTDNSDWYRFTLSQTRNLIINYNGSPELAALRLGIDRNNDGSFLGVDDQGFPTYVSGNDPNFNGRQDQGEGLTKPFALNDVFGQQLSGDVVYTPLPPFYDPASGFRATKDEGGFFTTVPTAIYARLDPGTYYLQVDPQATTVDLGDGLTRYGRANILYNLSFVIDG